MSELSIPLVDIGGLHGDDMSRKKAIAQELRSACIDRGFFYVRNHGVSDSLIEKVMLANAMFFQQETTDKLALDKRLSPCNRGYEPLSSQTLQMGTPPDLKESFYIGNEVAADDPRVVAGRFNTGPNQWPVLPPEFRETMTEYFDEMHSLGTLLVRSLEQSLSLDPGYFDDYLDDAAATLRLLHYPPQPANPAPGEKGCGEHTDFGGITLLLQDEVGGLQVWDARDLRWIDAPPIPGTFVVNIGDLFARWTNGRYHSTLHRVLNASGRERYSVPFFFTGNSQYVVECLPSCLEPGEASKFSAVTVEQHLRECYARTYG